MNEKLTQATNTLQMYELDKITKEDLKKIIVSQQEGYLKTIDNMVSEKENLEKLNSTLQIENEQLKIYVQKLETRCFIKNNDLKNDSNTNAKKSFHMDSLFTQSDINKSHSNHKQTQSYQPEPLEQKSRIDCVIVTHINKNDHKKNEKSFFSSVTPKQSQSNSRLRTPRNSETKDPNVPTKQKNDNVLEALTKRITNLELFFIYQK